jgi:hypothetical protein
MDARPSATVELPVTPSNETRRPKLNTLGYDAPLDAVLLPMGIGLGLTVIVILLLMAKVVVVSWPIAVIAVGTPAGLAHLYMLKFVVGAPPHAQRDTLARWSCLTIDWQAAPIPWLPFVPGFCFDMERCGKPEPPEVQHPLRLLEQELRMRELAARAPRGNGNAGRQKKIKNLR